jgi:hypothetical protein
MFLSSFNFHVHLTLCICLVGKCLGYILPFFEFLLEMIKSAHMVNNYVLSR